MAVYVKKEDWENASLWGEKSVSLNPNNAKTLASPGPQL